MLLLLSKFARKNSLNLPTKCYAFDYLPDSINCICDCEINCKFPPKTKKKQFITNKYYPITDHEINYVNILKNKIYN